MEDAVKNPTTQLTGEDDAAEQVPEAEQAAPAAADESPEAAEPQGATFFQMLATVPDAIRKYLVSQQLVDAREKIYQEAGLTPDERVVVLHTDLEVFFGDLPLADFPDELWSRLPWKDEDEARAKKLILDILGFVFRPAQAFLGDVTGLIAELGGDLKQYPETQIELRRVTYMDGAREIAESASVAGMTDDMRKRLAHIIESRLRQVRDDADTKEMLMKAKKTGGLELSDADADAIMTLLASKMRMTKFVEAIEEEKPAAPAGTETAPAPAKEFTPIEIKKIYSGSAEEQENLKKRMARFAQVTGNDAEKMREAYYQVLFPPDLRPTDPLYVVAGLVVMADGDRFSDAVENDDRYRNILRNFLTDKGREAEIAAYDEGPTEPRFMNMVLQLLLRGVAGYDEAESARFALRYLNTLKKQGFDRYADFVAFDMEKGAFRWKDTIEL